MPAWLFTSLVASGGPDAVALSATDAAALIGIVSRLQGESMLGQLDSHLEAAIAGRLRREGLAPSADAVGLQSALAGLAERLHAALGE